MNRTTTHAVRNRGFTLIELMVTVAIVAILAAFAYPSYMNNVHRSSRGDASAAVNTLANDLERFYSLNSTYTTDLSKLSLPLVGEYALSNGGKYLLSVSAGPTSSIESSYWITAIPKSGTSQAGDSDCQLFKMNSLSQRIPDPHTSKCW